MREDRIRWNRKHTENPVDEDPSPVVPRFCGIAPMGRALDIAAGTGRNSRYLAGQGFTVEAVDISDVALTRLAESKPGIQCICADLDRFDIPKRRYELIVNVRFLSRRLFPGIIEGLVSGGVLIFQSYLEGGDRPMCPDYLLRENELLHGFLSMRIRHYTEASESSKRGTGMGRVATLVAIK